MSHDDCPFCRVVRGELRPRIVLETANVIAVVNNAEPQARGHIVFFPKNHAARLDQLSDGDLAEILVAVKRVAVAMGLENYNVLQNNGALAGQTVFHAHLHLIPKWSEHEGLRYAWEAGRKYEQDDLYEKLKKSLSDTAG
jgi:diadenosine tetraphosphate (Ap4A) HIT family hydrolase